MTTALSKKESVTNEMQERPNSKKIILIQISGDKVIFEGWKVVVDQKRQKWPSLKSETSGRWGYLHESKSGSIRKRDQNRRK
jgi:hypothetical protein